MKSPLILLHGALGDKMQFDALASQLEASFVIHNFNFEGHGNRLPAGRPFRIKHFVENIIEYAEGHNLKSLNLMGYSMGGYAALLLAASQPARVQKVFTLATKIRWDEETAIQETAMLNPEKMREKIPAFVNALSQKHTAMGWAKVVEETSALLKDLGENNYLNEKALAAITCPVKITVGDKDRTVSMEECYEATASIKDCSVEILQDTPHPFEKVEIPLLAASIKAFFK